MNEALETPTPGPGFWAIGIITTAFADTLGPAQRDHFAASLQRTAAAFIAQGSADEASREALTAEAEWVDRLARELMFSLPPT
jgi:hypothetical protein